MRAPLTCPNGHAMDEGLFYCPACGAYRPSASDPRALIRRGRVVGVKPPPLSERGDFLRRWHGGETGWPR
jgi:hypothetical protein